ncbi:MAG: hypothetical protein LBE76_08415 [Nitrososphaerota archaeon]|jgi:hypothetical protein|nr:hypothetical protein [Nitrososphaerota archaeon]
MDLLDLAIQIIVNVVILAPILWFSGRMLVGAQKAKFTDALWIVALGSIVGAIFGYFDFGFIGAIVMLLIFLALVKHFFDCGWLKALLISIVAVIIFVILVAVLAVIGVGLGLGLGMLGI